MSTHISYLPIFLPTENSQNSNSILCRLSKIAEDWHEHESKALRKENERRDREARKVKDEARDKEKKRPMEGTDSQRDPKRVQLDERPRAEQSNKPAKKEVANGVE